VYRRYSTAFCDKIFVRILWQNICTAYCDNIFVPHFVRTTFVPHFLTKYLSAFCDKIFVLFFVPHFMIQFFVRICQYFDKIRKKKYSHSRNYIILEIFLTRFVVIFGPPNSNTGATIPRWPKITIKRNKIFLTKKMWKFRMFRN